MTVPASVWANNIMVTNSTMVTVGNGVGRIRFDISWENSWKTNTAPNNHDAAWIFVKYREAGTLLWRHVYLKNGTHTTSLGIVDHENGREDPSQAYDANTNRTVGVFLRRQNNSIGTFTAHVELNWDHLQYGITLADIDSVKVFAIEMVYVPQGSYTLGSGGTELGHFHTYPDESSTYQVTGEAMEINVGPTAGYLFYPDTLGNLNYHWGDQLGPIPAAFPKGYAAFYMMKHEVAQRDYVDFLNCLTRAQQARHTGNMNNSLLAPGVATVDHIYVMCDQGNVADRQTIRCDAVVDPEAPVTFYCDADGDGVGNEDGDGQWVACNYLHWLDLGAYLDWCGLRPMTELEFVKAARGAQQAPVPNEYAWGNASATRASIINDEYFSDEACGTSGANAVYGYLINNPNGVPGPMRVGVFAASGTSRAQAGAGYYGALDLSGNVGELAVTVGFPAGRSFDGTLGDGELDSLGYANAPTWPGSSYFNGIGVMGGAWVLDNSYLRTSDRHVASHVTFSSRSKVNGGRGVRDAPVLIP